MAEMTTREAYAAVSRAIIELATGKVASFQIGSRSVTYVDLKRLRELKAELAQEIRAEETEANLLGGATVAFFDRR